MKKTRDIITLSFTLCLLLVFGGTALAADDAADSKHEYTQGTNQRDDQQSSRRTWLLFLQNDTTWYDGDALDFLGEDEKVFNTTTIQPVLPFQLTENWKYILRPVITLNSWDVPSASAGTPTFYPGGELPFSVDWDRKLALGDTVLWNAFATNEMATPPNIFGFGITLMVPTATNDIFGTNKWNAGPMGLGCPCRPAGWVDFRCRGAALVGLCGPK